jgi:hypothetical protein
MMNIMDLELSLSTKHLNINPNIIIAALRDMATIRGNSESPGVQNQGARVSLALNMDEVKSALNLNIAPDAFGITLIIIKPLGETTESGKLLLNGGSMGCPTIDKIVTLMCMKKC